MKKRIVFILCLIFSLGNFSESVIGSVSATEKKDVKKVVTKNKTNENVKTVANQKKVSPTTNSLKNDSKKNKTEKNKCPTECLLEKPNKNVEIKEIGEKSLNSFDLVDILDLALKNNPKIKQAWLDVEVGDRAYKIARADYFPNITGSVSYSYNDYNDKKVKSDAHSIGLDFLLFNFGGRYNNVQNFKHKLNSIKYTTNGYVQNFVYKVIKSYYDLLSSMANEKSTKELEIFGYETYKAAKIRYEIGLAPLTDKLQAETSYNQRVLAREKAENNTKIMRANLNYLLNLSPDNKIELSVPSLNLGSKEANMEGLIEKALKNRSDLQAYNETKKAKKAELFKARTDFLPSIGLSSSYTHKHFRDSLDENEKGYSVGLEASVPFFTGGEIYNKQAKVKAELNIIDQQINDLQKDIELDVWTAYQNFVTAKKTYLTTEILVKSAKESADTMLGRYKNGKSSILDLLQTQSNLAEARYEFIQARHNWFIQKSNLVRALGEIDINNVSSSIIEDTLVNDNNTNKGV